MRRLILATSMAMIAVILGFAACSKEPPKPTQPTNVVKEPPKPTQPTNVVIESNLILRIADALERQAKAAQEQAAFIKPPTDEVPRGEYLRGYLEGCRDATNGCVDVMEKKGRLSKDEGDAFKMIISDGLSKLKQSNSTP